MIEEQFRQWMGLISEPALLVTGDGRVLAANAAVKSVGLEASALAGRRLAEIAETPEEQIGSFLKLCSRVREPVLGALSLRGSDGDAVPCACRGMLAPGTDPARERTLVIRLTPKVEATRRYTLLEEKIAELNEQIGRRMELETQLKERNEYLQVTLSSIGDGVIVTDPEARVVMLNPVAESLTGWKSAEAVGQPLKTVFDIVNQTTRRHVENPVIQALREGVVVGLANHTVLIAKDGVERPIDDSAAAILNARREVLGAVLVFRDITERYRSQARLREQTDLFTQLADAIPQLAWMANPNGSVHWYNERWYEYTGARPEEMADEGWQAFHDPELLPSIIEVWQNSLRIGKPFSMVFPLRGADGRYRPFLTNVRPFRDADGEVVRWFGTNTDISEQKQLEDELRLTASRLQEANRRKDEFLAILAHELRNPLAPIRTGLELMKVVGDDPQQREEARAIMERQTIQLISLVDDLLDVSRITRGKLELRRRQVELSSVVASALEASRPVIDEGRHRLETSLPKEPVVVDVDPNRLAQVFANLLNNAAKYTAPGGRISVQAERRGDQVAVAVRDNGLGIPPEKQEEIFEMFTQIDHPQERGQTGLGIGLTLVKTLVELHGGSIAVESSDEGSIFTVSLPVVAAELPGCPENEVDAPASKASRRVLVVDDNRPAAKMLAMLVKLSGYEVRVAHDGREALDVAEDFRPDIVLMDLGMPSLNGYDAAREMRQRDWGRSVLLVAVSGWGQTEDRRRTTEAGFDHHLVKPVDPAGLRKLLCEG